MTNVRIYFVGTAGSGKTSLVASFAEWMRLNSFDSITVNLDPGAGELPYEPDIDIRDYFTLQSVMDEYSLGPNGAQIVSADLLALRAKDIRETIDQFETDYVLIDTPGQIELFAFRESSKAMANMLGEQSIIVFLFDPGMARNPSGYLSLLMLSSTVQFRFNYPLFSVLSKCDMLAPMESEEIKAWADYPDALYEILSQETANTETLVSNGLFRALEDIGINGPGTSCSAETGEGLEDIYNVVQNLFAGGEDIERSYPDPEEKKD